MTAMLVAMLVGVASTPNAAGPPEGAAPTAAALTPATSSADPIPQGSGPVLLPGIDVPRAPRIHRRGNYLGFGTGFGFSNYAQKSFAGSGSALLGIRAGAIVGDQLLIGPEVLLTGQFNRWAESVQVGTGLSSVMMEGMIFPWANLPLNFSVGAGWGSGIRVDRLNKSKNSTPVEAAGDEGLSWMVAAGWDLAPGPGSNFGLQLRYDGSHFLGSDVSAAQGFSLGLWLNTY